MRSPEDVKKALESILADAESGNAPPRSPIETAALLFHMLVAAFGEDFVLAALRPVLGKYLTPDAIARANKLADAAEDAKFGSSK